MQRNTRSSLCALLGINIALATVAAAPVQSGHWLQWRGPFHTGMAVGDAPLRWSDTEGVTWKAAIPGRGFSTPVIVGDRIFLTTGDSHGKRPGADRSAAWGGRRRRLRT